MTTAAAEFAVIGGSGFYEFLTDTTEIAVTTPFGEPSDTISVGTLGGRRVAFLPRHGRRHQFPPHRVPYRANLWALRALGVRQIVAPCAVGSLRPELGPGTLVVPDQLVDRTRHRAQTFYDAATAIHVSFADPYCPNGRAAAVAAARAADWAPVDGGTMVVVDGPRFSTRAESLWHAAQGWSIVGMTGHPEAILAREFEMCLTSVALVTDLDAGFEVGDGVTHEEVLRVFAGNVQRLRPLMADILAALPTERNCLCAHALDGQRTPFDLP